MKWVRSFEIGCNKVDSQHQELVGLVAQLEKDLSVGIPGKQLADALRFIVHYTRYHFDSEELFMANIGYPELEKHKQIHDELIDKVNCILLDLKTGKKLEAKDLYQFLAEWVKSHVLEEDKKIGDFYRLGKASTEELLMQKDMAQKKGKIIAYFNKLKDLFLKKLITIEDFREQKVKFIVSLFKNGSFKNLRAFFHEVEELVLEDLLTEKEKDSITFSIFSDFDFNKTLGIIPDAEGKLFFLRNVQELELVDEELIAEEKEKILQKI
jgi:hemerythrin